MAEFVPSARLKLPAANRWVCIGTLVVNFGISTSTTTILSFEYVWLILTNGVSAVVAARVGASRGHGATANTRVVSIGAAPWQYLELIATTVRATDSVASTFATCTFEGARGGVASTIGPGTCHFLVGVVVLLFDSRSVGGDLDFDLSAVGGDNGGCGASPGIG